MEVQNNDQLPNYPPDYNQKTKSEKGESEVEVNLTQPDADANIETSNSKVTTELTDDQGKGIEDVQDDEMWYVKNPQAAQTKGYSYRVKLAMWFLLCGKEKIEKKEITSFFLAADIKEAPTFGHIVFKYQKEGCRSRAIFLQAKHRENVTHKMNNAKPTTSSNDFDLMNAWNAYKHITKCFSSKKVDNRLFGDDLSDVECSFVFFTNASPNIDYTNINKMTVDPEDILYFNKANSSYCSLKPCQETGKIVLNCNASSNIQDFNKFLRKLRLQYKQPNEEELGEIIKQKIRSMFSVEEKFVETVFASAQTQLQEWFRSKGTSNFLTRENRFFEDAARVSIKFDVKEPVGLFTGRKKELDNLHKILQNGGEAVISQAASITGIGGVGKTELARKYISEHSKEYDNNVIWINAENYTTATESFIRVAEEKLGINTLDENGKRRKTQKVVQEVYDYFERMRRRSLFVFDNTGRYKALSDTDEGIDKFLPSGPDKPYAIITSRDQEWGQIKTLALDLFTQDEAADFIRKALTDVVAVEESKVNTLAAELQYLPLALTQAVAYIKMENTELSRSDKTGFTVNNYLQLLKTKTRDLLCSCGSNNILDRYSGTVMTTWHITIAKIKQTKTRGEAALDILNIMSFLASDKILVDDIFSTLIDDEQLRHSAVELLDKYCMVSLRGGKVNVHRLVQQVTRINLEERGKTREIVQKTFTMLKESFPYGDEKLPDINNKKALLPHLEAFLSHIQPLITQKSTDASEEEKNIYFHLIPLMVDGYYDLGNPQREKELLEAALPSFVDHYGPNHFQVATTLVNLGNAHGDLGDQHTKKELLERALKIEEDHYGPKHFKVTITLESLGNANGALGDQHKKKELLERALKIGEDHYGPNHFQIATVLVNLGNAYGALGDPSKQKELLERALKIQEDHYGPNHFRLAITLGSLSNAHSDLGDPSKQKEQLERALKIQEDHYGPNHFRVAATLVNLGVAHGSLGNPSKQKELLERALKIDEDHYGPNNFQIATTLVNLGNAHGSLGDSSKKKEQLERALKILEDHYGPNHFGVAITLVNLGNAHGDLGDQHTKKELLERALKILEDHYGPNHFHVAAALVYLGNAHGDLGDPSKQKELLERALKIEEDHYGPNHFYVATTLVNLGVAHCSLGDPSKQKELSEQALKIQEAYYGPNQFQVAITLENLGVAHGSLGDPSKQKELLERALKIKEDHYGPNHFQVARTLENLGVAHGDLGDPSKQKELLERALKIQEDHYGPNHFEVTIILESLGNANGALGNQHTKKELLERALKIKEDHYGPNHFHVATTLVNLGVAHGSLGDPSKQKELSEQALKIQEDHYGPNHFYVAIALENLGNANGALGNQHTKKELLERALKIKEDHYGPNHFKVATTLVNLGNAHGALGDQHTKKELLERALKIEEDHYGPNHFQVATTLANLSNAHCDLGDQHTKNELCERAIKIA